MQRLSNRRPKEALAAAAAFCEARPAPLRRSVTSKLGQSAASPGAPPPIARKMIQSGRTQLRSSSAVAMVAPAQVTPQVNDFYLPQEHAPPTLTPQNNRVELSHVSGAHWSEHAWSTAAVRAAQEHHVVGTWGPTNAMRNVPILERGAGVYLYDREGREYLDWTSQAVCANLGYDVPPAVVEAVTRQLTTLPMAYGGLGMTEVRGRMAQLLAEIMPGDLNGFLFPSGGAEANEAAVRIARRYTGRHKILSHYRSYHGGTTATLGATGDFRRNYAEAGATGFVKMLSPLPHRFSWGDDEAAASYVALAALEEQLLGEGPDTIAAIMLESIVGAGGVLVHPAGYMEGVRALCDKYGIQLICDEVMVGFGRTGQMWGFQHYDHVLPDLVTSAKGLSASYMPIAMVGMRQHLQDHFKDVPLGWGSTYQAHPVSLACAYECVKHLLQHDLVGHAQRLEPLMREGIQQLIDRHVSVKQGRAVGLFGCVDLVGHDGQPIMPLQGPPPPAVHAFKQALADEGVYGLVRPPFLHCAPPLVISPDELLDGFGRVSRALDTLDAHVLHR